MKIILFQKERDEAQKSLDEKTEWAKQQLQGLGKHCRQKKGFSCSYG